MITTKTAQEIAPTHLGQHWQALQSRPKETGVTLPEAGAVGTLSTAVALGLRWLFALNARINEVEKEAKAMHKSSMDAIVAHERTCDERMSRLDERHEHIMEKLREIHADMRKQ